LNLQPSAPHADALAKLRYTPIGAETPPAAGGFAWPVGFAFRIRSIAKDQPIGNAAAASHVELRSTGPEEFRFTNAMHYEVEQKFALADPSVVRAELGRLGAVFEPSIDQADTYFRHPGRDFAATDEALRVRQVGETNYVTYKGPKLDLQTKTRQEMEVPIGPGPEMAEQFSEILLALGFGPVFTIRKRREPGTIEWQGLPIHIALDQVEQLGAFVELEAIADDHSLPAARIAVLSLAEELKLTGVERRSYLELALGGKS
jgi:adenylate cyclase, class 2